MDAVNQQGADLAKAQDRGARFVFSLLWNWLGVGAGLFTGLVLAPYLFRKLGAEGYGLWGLSFALVEYGTFLDLGFRSAVVKYVAHFWALEDNDGVERIINTGLMYAALVSGAIFAVMVLVSGDLKYFFKISPEFQHSFKILVIIVSLSWCCNFVFSLFGACLEAIQRFDFYNQAGVSSTIARAVGIALLLYLGYGLIALGVLVVFTQCLGYTLYYFLFRRTAPWFRISPRYASLKTLRTMGSFGIHTFVVNVSNLLLNQSPPVLIGHLLPAAFVGFYRLPMNLIQYTSEAVGRIGIITNASSAEFQARGDSRAIENLAVYANRYSLTLFMPLALVFWIFSDRIFQRWIPAAASYAAPLLPVLVTGYMIGFVAQYSSGMLLQGLGRHQRFSRGLLVEAIGVIALLLFVIPRYGIFGAACVIAGCMILNRGIFAPWLVSREMGFSYFHFMQSIYTRPFLTAIPVAALAWFLRTTILPGYTWLQLLAVGAIVATAYFGMAYFACLPPHHRSRLSGLVAQRLPFRSLRAAA